MEQTAVRSGASLSLTLFSVFEVVFRVLTGHLALLCTSPSVQQQLSDHRPDHQCSPVGFRQSDQWESIPQTIAPPKLGTHSTSISNASMLTDNGGGSSNNNGIPTTAAATPDPR